MGLDFAIDELVASGWSTLDSAGCEYHSDGRPFPSFARICEEFRAAGYELTVRFVQLFDCYRAEWRDTSNFAAGAVVGQTQAEAAVYAFAQLRRQLAAAGC